LKQNKTENLLGKPCTPFSKAIILNTDNIRTSVMSQTKGLFKLLSMHTSGQCRMLEIWMGQADGDVLPSCSLSRKKILQNFQEVDQQ